VKKGAKEVENNNSGNQTSDIQMKLPATDSEAQNFEKNYVHSIYNQIADHFSHTRHSAWPGVAKFIESMEIGSTMCDVGCGKKIANKFIK